jgi:hypothetical protein
VDPNNSDVVFISQIDVYRSVNGADTFTNLTCGYAGGEDVHVDNHGRTFVGASSADLIVSSDGGVYISHNANAADPNAVAFTQMNDTLSTIEWYSGDITSNFAYDDEDPGINAGAQDNGSAIFVWEGVDPGPAVWQLCKGGDGMYARIEPKQENRWYQESQNGNVAVTTSPPPGGGEMCSPQVNATGPWGSDRLSFIFPYEIDKFNCPNDICDHMIAGTYRVWETVFGAVPANSWKANSPDLTKGTLADRSVINQLAYGTSDGSIAIAGTNDGNVWYGFELGQDVANSATWVNVTGSNAVLPNRPILDVVTDPINPLVGYAAVGGFDENTPTTPGHVFEVTCTADCASFTWADKSGNLPNIPVDSITVNPNWASQVFAGTDWGLYYTDDINADDPVWNYFDAGTTRAMIWDMAVDRAATTLALFTRSRGAYAWPLPRFVTTDLELRQDAAAGATATYEFTVTNQTASSQSYDLELSGNDWPTTIVTSSPINIGAGASATVEVEVDVPAGTPAGERDMFNLWARQVGDDQKVARGMGVTTSLGGDEEYGVDLTVDDDTKSGIEGATVTYTLTVTNTGTVADSFELALAGNLWPTTLSATNTGSLDPGASTTITVDVVVGSEAMDMVTVTATSDTDPLATASVMLMTSREAGMHYTFLPLILKQ